MKIFKRVVLAIFIVILVSVLVLIGNGYSIYKNALKEMPLSDKVQAIREKENYVELEELPEIYLKAVVSVEDHRFYEHNGIDIIAIGRAVFNDIKSMSFAQGGSTITQQIAKNIYFTQEKKFTRKIAEAFMAFDLEKNYEKDEILELYLNTSYFGDGYHTAKEAAVRIFWKRA